MRILHICALGLSLLASTRGFAAMNYQCTVSDPEYAHMAETFTVHEERDVATVSFGNLRALHDVVVYESADAGSRSVGEVRGNLQPQMLTALVQHTSATIARLDISRLLQGTALSGQYFVLEISRPVGSNETFDASATIWEEFVDGRRVIADFRDVGADGVVRIRSLQNLLGCQAL